MVHRYFIKLKLCIGVRTSTQPVLSLICSFCRVHDVVKGFKTLWLQEIILFQFVHLTWVCENHIKSSVRNKKNCDLDLVHRLFLLIIINNYCDLFILILWYLLSIFILVMIEWYYHCCLSWSGI